VDDLCTIKKQIIMAKEIKTEITVHATPEKVWSTLTDFKGYPEWNPFILSIAGDVAEGKRIQVVIRPPGMKGMTLQPTVLDYKPGKTLRWIGRLVFPGLFDGEHRFELIDNGDGSTTLIHSEKFRGILVPFLKKMLDNNTRQGFQMMNEALKKEAEQEQA
jgi:hypothetical protein